MLIETGYHQGAEEEITVISFPFFLIGLPGSYDISICTFDEMNIQLLHFPFLSRYKKLLCAVDLTKDFFFSYSYNVMQSLQKNLYNYESGPVLYETMFVWNEYLTRGIRNYLKNTLWTVALVYGFFKQVWLRNLWASSLFLSFLKILRIFIGTNLHQCILSSLAIYFVYPTNGWITIPHFNWLWDWGTCTTSCSSSNDHNIQLTAGVLKVYPFCYQVKLSASGKDFMLTLIARRSRHYAGTRYWI